MDLFADNGRLLFALATLFYLVASVLGLQTLRGKRPARLISATLMGGGFLIQTLALNWRGMQVQSCPIGNPFEILQFITWSLIVLFGFVGAAFRTSLLGFFTAGLAALISLVSLLVPAWDGVARGRLFAGQPLIELHAALSLFSYGAFALLALSSAMYLIQLYGLKSHSLQRLFNYIPSLVELERVSLRLLCLSVIVYSVALSVGAAAWIQSGETVTPLKLLFASFAFAGYLIALILRLAKRLVAERMAILCIALFAWSLLTLYPVEMNRDAQPQAEREAR